MGRCLFVPQRKVFTIKSDLSPFTVERAKKVWYNFLEKSTPGFAPNGGKRGWRNVLLRWFIYALPALLLGVVGVLLCKGKAGFLLAGWNTMPKEKKQSWDEKRLLHFNGRCILGLAALILLGALFTLLEIDWLVALSWVAFAALVVWMIVYQNTGNRFRR